MLVVLVEIFVFRFLERNKFIFVVGILIKFYSIFIRF